MVKTFSCATLYGRVGSLGVLISLSLASLTLIPSTPYISVVILPLLFCGWCFIQKSADWKIFGKHEPVWR